MGATGSLSVHCLVAALLCLSGAEAFASSTGVQLRHGTNNRALRTAGLSQLQCATSGDKSVQHVGRKHALQGAFSLLLVTAFGSEASAKKSKEKPCQPGLCVKATSPGIALDMIILMKSAQAMREAGEKVPIARMGCMIFLHPASAECPDLHAH